jgi:hypothetical protein
MEALRNFSMFLNFFEYALSVPNYTYRLMQNSGVHNRLCVHFDMQDNSKIVVREVNHKPWLYTFYSLLNLIPLYYLHMLMTVVGYGMSCLVT